MLLPPALLIMIIVSIAKAVMAEPATLLGRAEVIDGGTLTIAGVPVILVSFPAHLFPASSEGRVALNQIHRTTGERIRYEKVVPGLGPVDEADIVKGYEHVRGSHVLIRPDEIDCPRSTQLTWFASSIARTSNRNGSKSRSILRLMEKPPTRLTSSFAMPWSEQARSAWASS